MIVILLLIVVAVLMFAILGGPAGYSRRRGRTIVIERDSPADTVVVEREVVRPTVIEREYEV
jgi:hypothetical protein